MISSRPEMPATITARQHHLRRFTLRSQRERPFQSQNKRGSLSAPSSLISDP